MKCGKAVADAIPTVVVNTEVARRTAYSSLAVAADAEAAKQSESIHRSEMPMPERPQALVSAVQAMISTEALEPKSPSANQAAPNSKKASATFDASEPPRKTSVGGLVATAVLLVIAAGGAVGGWLYRQQMRKAAVTSPPSSIPAVSAPAAAPATTTPERSAKPMPGSPAQSTSSNNSALSAPSMVADTQSYHQKQPSLPQTFVPKSPPRVPITQDPEKEVVHEPTPGSLTLPATPPTGELHYSGPPVHPGGLVVFQHLPAGRLRFSFDHQAWQPLISRQTDGSQTLTLRSLKQGDQTECNVHWELAH